MDKLEQYLDQVCRRMGGPLEMRRHVRQELREHLLDAVAQHKAAGMAEAAALETALTEFGQADEVRSELEATHGQRTMWIIDKALQWKEKTMKAKWLWASWTYVALVGVIVLQALFIAFNVLFIIPKFEKLMHDGIIDPAILDEEGPRWMIDYLFNLSYIAGHYTLFLILVPVVAWGLFEWRVRSENKSFMRLSALGTAAVALAIVVVLMSGSLVITFCLGVPAMGRIARPWAVEQVNKIETAVVALEKATEKKDWPAMQEHTMQAISATGSLATGPALSSLTRSMEPGKEEALRQHFAGVRHALAQIEREIRDHNMERLQTGLRELRKSFDVVLDAAKKPPRQ